MAHRWKPLHLQYYDPAFNSADSLFNSPVFEAVYCFFRSLLALWENSNYGRTNKEKVDDNKRWKLGRELLQLPAITDYCHRCHERQRNENLRDYNFEVTLKNENI